MKNTIRSSAAVLLTLILTLAHAAPALARAVPVAASFSTAVPANRQSLVQLQGSDAEGTSLTYATTSTPSHGALSSLNTATGYVVYTPTTGYTGSDSFTYTVTSGGETSAAGTVTITVTTQKTTVSDTITDASGNPRSGKVTFILTQAVVTPAGITPVGSSVSASLSPAGQFSLAIYPSRSMNPAAYYQVWFNDGATLRQELLGVYDIPASTSAIGLSGYKVTDTNLAARYTFASLAGLEALKTAVADASLAQLVAQSRTTGYLQKWDGTNLSNSIVSEVGSTATVQGGLNVTGTVTASGGFGGITNANLPSTISGKTFSGTHTGDGSGLTNLPAPVLPASPTFSGTVTAGNFVGGGAGITGLTGATGGVANTGSTTIGADTDANGVGKISLQTGGVERVGVEADGTVSIPGGLAVYDKGGTVYNVAAYGITGAAHSGTPSNESTALSALLTTVYNAGGGTIVFNSRKYRFDSQIVLPNNGATPPFQPAIRITGAGATFVGTGTPAPNGGTVIDLRYLGTPAKIDTRGTGLLEIDHLSLVDGGGVGGTPFIQTTNTTLNVHHAGFFGALSGASANNDAIILGGTSTTVDGSANAPFQGYGTVIHDNYFSKIRRGAYFRTYSNASVFAFNTFWNTCGGTAAIELVGDVTNSTSGNVITGNLIEMVNYTFGIRLQQYAVNNMLDRNNFYDANIGATALIRLESGATFNHVIAGFRSGSTTHVSDLNATKTNTLNTFHQSEESLYPQPARFYGGVTLEQGGQGVILQDASGNQSYAILVSASQLGFYGKPSGGSQELWASLSRASATDKRFTLEGTTNNQISAAGGNLRLLAPSGQTLFLGDTAGSAQTLTSGLTTFLNGISGTGTGAKHATVSTGSIAAGARGDVTLSWGGSNFANTTYTVVCSVTDTSAAGAGLRFERVRTKAVGSIVAQVINDSAGALTGTLECWAPHS